MDFSRRRCRYGVDASHYQEVMVWLDKLYSGPAIAAADRSLPVRNIPTTAHTSEINALLTTYHPTVWGARLTSSVLT